MKMENQEEVVAAHLSSEKYLTLLATYLVTEQQLKMQIQSWLLKTKTEGEAHLEEEAELLTVMAFSQYPESFDQVRHQNLFWREFQSS